MWALQLMMMGLRNLVRNSITRTAIVNVFVKTKIWKGIDNRTIF